MRAHLAGKQFLTIMQITIPEFNSVIKGLQTHKELMARQRDECYSVIESQAEVIRKQDQALVDLRTQVASLAAQLDEQQEVIREGTESRYAITENLLKRDEEIRQLTARLKRLQKKGGKK